MRRPVAVVLGVLAGLPLGAQQVTLPLAQFEELRAKADPQPDKPPVPPALFALEAAELTVEVGTGSARLATTLVLTLFAEGWQSVPVGEAGSFVAAEWGGLEGRIEAVKDRGWVLKARGKGRHTVRLTSVVQADRDETATVPTRRVQLVAPGAAVVTGKILVPADVAEVTLTGPGLVERSGDGRWSLLAAPRAALSIVLTGKRTTPERALLPLRFEATSATATKLSRTRLTVAGAIEVRVAQGRLPEVKVAVPAGYQVVAVRGAIAGWNVADGRLVVTPLEPIETALAVEVELAGEPKDSFAAPLLLVDGSARTLLYAKASLSGDGLLALADPGSVRPAEDREAQRLAPSVAAVPGPLLAVADPARPPLWLAEWAEKTEVLAAQIDKLVVDVAVGVTGHAVYQLWAEVRNRGAQQLSFAMPPGFELVLARRDGLAVAPGLAGPAGTAGLAVPLATGEAAQVVHLQGLLPLSLPAGQGDLSVPLPVLSVPASRVEMRVILPGGRSYALAEPARAGRVSTPQTRGARRNVSKLAQQVNLYQAPESVAGPGFLSVPAGFGVLEAAWSAVSPRPSPLVIRVKLFQEKAQWF